MFSTPQLQMRFHGYSQFDYNYLSSSDTDDTIDLINSPKYPSSVIYSPQPLSSGEYGVFADYITPLYTNNKPYQQYPQYSVDPLTIPGAQLISDEIEYLDSKEDEVISDDIEFFAEESNYANMSNFYNETPPIKKLTRIIRYVKSFSSSSKADSESCDENLEEINKNIEKSIHKKKRRHHKRSSKKSREDGDDEDEENEKLEEAENLL